MEAPAFDSAQGRFVLTLLRDPTWIARRVETTRIVDLERLERRLTLDIDVRRLSHIARRSGLGNHTRFVVPVALLSKGLLLDLDATDTQGNSLAVATRTADSAAARDALFVAASGSQRLGFRDRIRLRGSRTLRAKLYEVAHEIASESDVHKITQLAKRTEVEYVDGWKLDVPSTRAGGALEGAWIELFKDEEFGELLATLTVRFMLMVSVNASDRVAILKLRFVEATEPADTSRPDPFNARLILDLPVSYLSAAQRNHVRIVAPTGVAVQGSALFRPYAEELDEGEAIKPSDIYNYSETSERAMFYLPAADRDSIELAFI